MRDLKDYKNEIFALGEKKIKERRRRIAKTAAITTPLCLCVVMLGVAVMPALVSADKAAPELREEMDMVGSSDDEYTDSFSLYSATVNTPDGIITRIIDEDKKTELFELFSVDDDGAEDFSDETILSHEAVGAETATEEETAATENLENKKESYLFKIVFEHKNGDKDVYTVTNDSIIDGNGFRTKISEEALEKIKQLLGDN